MKNQGSKQGPTMTGTFHHWDPGTTICFLEETFELVFCSHSLASVHVTHSMNSATHRSIEVKRHVSACKEKAVAVHIGRIQGHHSVNRRCKSEI